MARKKSDDLVLLGIGGLALWYFGKQQAAKRASAAAVAAKGAPTPGISPTPPQSYTVPSGGPRWGGRYSPYAGYSGSGQQPGSQTGRFAG